jgi:Putative DNA-binding domain
VLSLVDYQRQVAAVLLDRSGEAAAAAAELPTACRPGLEVHRRTVFQALVKALQFTFPTVVRLTGESFFERAASHYIRSHPPLGAVLYDYGSEFPAYLATYSGLERYPYFCDVARFDLYIDRASHFDPTTCGSTLVFAKNLRLRLSASLMCLQTNYPVDQIRDCLDAGRPDSLANLNMAPQPRHFALWRSQDGTSVKALSPRAALFLQALLAKSDVVDALRQSTGRSPYGQAATVIYDEIAASGFARVSRPTEPGVHQ